MLPVVSPSNLLAQDITYTELILPEDKISSSSPFSNQSADLPLQPFLSVYQNSTYGIEILYSGDWIPFEHTTTNTSDQGIVTLLSSKSVLNDTLSSPVILGIWKRDLSSILNMTLDNYTSLSLGERAEYDLLESEQTSLAGYPARSVVYVDNATKAKILEIWTVIENREAYHVRYVADMRKYDDYLSIVLPMINSVRLPR